MSKYATVGLIKTLPSILDVRREKARRHLYDFTVQSWDIIEPGAQFIDNWHIGLICEYLEAVTIGQIKRLIINIQPRCMKSILVSVNWPVWTWIDRPEERWMFTSYAQSLSNKHSIDRRRIIKSNWYQSNWGHIYQLTDDQDQKMEYENDKRGHMIATSVGGTATGKGGNRLVGDDILNPKEAVSDTKRQFANDYLDQTFLTRMDDKKNGSFVLIMQRLHEKDPTGHLMEKGGYTLLKLDNPCGKKTILTAPISKLKIVREEGEVLWPEREGKAELDQARIDLGSMGYSAQYEQSPAPATGSVIKILHFNFYQTKPVHWHKVMCQSWDCNFKNKVTADYVAGEVWSKVACHYFLVDIIKKKMGIVETMASILSWEKKYPGAIAKYVEDAANGPAVMQILEDTVSGLIPVTPEGGKLARVNSVLPLIEAGNVWLPCVSDPTAWNNTPVQHRTKQMLDEVVKTQDIEDFLTSCAKFPNGANDDDVDSMTQALIKLRLLQGAETTISNIAVGRVMEMAQEIA